jgi:hypothetical protein
MPQQISVFVENKPGKLKRITEVLEENSINIRAVTISDSGDYGIIKLLVDRPLEGSESLKEDGFAATLKDIVAVRLTDKPGSLRVATTALADKGVNIEDAYGFILGNGQAVFVFQVENVQKAEHYLKEAGFHLLANNELYLL